eukprot:scpid31386/ scgid8123/ 
MLCTHLHATHTSAHEFTSYPQSSASSRVTANTELQTRYCLHAFHVHLSPRPLVSVFNCLHVHSCPCPFVLSRGIAAVACYCNVYIVYTQTCKSADTARSGRVFQNKEPFF